MTARPLKIIGHRGAKGLAPENTVASLKKALEHHADEIEVDVHATKDEVAVLCHDDSIKSDDGSEIKTAVHTLKELRARKADLATLEDAILAINRAVPLIIEVKSNVPIEPIVAVINKFLSRGWKSDDFLLASFDFKILRSLHAELPEITKVVNEHYFGTRATYRARKLQTKRLCMNHQVLWFGFIKSVSRNYLLYAYTLNSPDKARRWAKYGLAGIVTDYPDKFES
jgi:glycerophosphoryl diester phosphodiesterase